MFLFPRLLIFGLVLEGAERTGFLEALRNSMRCYVADMHPRCPS